MTASRGSGCIKRDDVTFQGRIIASFLVLPPFKIAVITSILAITLPALAEKKEMPHATFVNYADYIQYRKDLSQYRFEEMCRITVNFSLATSLGLSLALTLYGYYQGVRAVMSPGLSGRQGYYQNLDRAGLFSSTVMVLYCFLFHYQPQLDVSTALQTVLLGTFVMATSTLELYAMWCTLNFFDELTSARPIVHAQKKMEKRAEARGEIKIAVDNGIQDGR